MKGVLHLFGRDLVLASYTRIISVRMKERYPVRTFQSPVLYLLELGFDFEIHLLEPSSLLS